MSSRVFWGLFHKSRWAGKCSVTLDLPLWHLLISFIKRRCRHVAEGLELVVSCPAVTWCAVSATCRQSYISHYHLVNNSLHPMLHQQIDGGWCVAVTAMWTVESKTHNAMLCYRHTQWIKSGLVFIYRLILKLKSQRGNRLVWLISWPKWKQSVMLNLSECSKKLRTKINILY